MGERDYPELNPEDRLMLDATFDSLRSKLKSLTPEELRAREEAARNQIKNSVGMVLSTTTERERLVLQHRFGLADGVSRSLRQTAQEMGISHTTVLRDQKLALSKLRVAARDMQ